MYEYLNRLEDYIGRKITHIKPKFTFEEYFYQVPKGKQKIRGFIPPMYVGWCTALLKNNPMRKYCNENNVDIQYMGFGFDEFKRSTRKYQKEKYQYPLIEMGITSAHCIDILKERGIYNSLYDYNNRTGCWCCPKQDLKSIRFMYKHHPELWNKMLQYAKDSTVGLKFDIARLNEKWNNQPTIDDWE
jgi:3'-phosphoadenosine 5'-phosphosulfate sulfotransferase (PAPS reductase)/FAD synthetase